MNKLFIVLLLVSPFAHALVTGPITIKGKIKSFDSKTVVIQSQDYNYIIPKEFVKTKSIKSGNQIEVLLSSDQYQEVLAQKIKSPK